MHNACPLRCVLKQVYAQEAFEEKRKRERQEWSCLRLIAADCGLFVYCDCMWRCSTCLQQNTQSKPNCGVARLYKLRKDTKKAAEAAFFGKRA